MLPNPDPKIKNPQITQITRIKWLQPKLSVRALHWEIGNQLCDSGLRNLRNLRILIPILGLPDLGHMRQIRGVGLRVVQVDSKMSAEFLPA
jgi:hypothetical protein